MLAGDNELGYVYLPTGAPTNDYYGADRPGDNLFSQSIIAVDVETGQRAWHFQAVHHGLWDYDFPTHPNLLDVTVDGREIKALAQVSKQGFVYAFDRVTGEPIWPIEERPVPQYTNLPDEAPARTQPFPTRPPPFEHQGVEIDALVDFTPEIRAMAVEAVADLQLGPLFTPPLRSLDGGVQGTIQRPAIDGGANWGGAGVDPETGLLYVPSSNRFSVLHFYTPDPPPTNAVLRAPYTMVAARWRPVPCVVLSGLCRASRWSTTTTSAPATAPSWRRRPVRRRSSNPSRAPPRLRFRVWVNWTCVCTVGGSMNRAFPARPPGGCCRCCRRYAADDRV